MPCPHSALALALLGFPKYRDALLSSAPPPPFRKTPPAPGLVKPLPATAILLLLAGALWWAGRPSLADPAARPGAPAAIAGGGNPAAAPPAGPSRVRSPRTPPDSRLAAEYIELVRERHQARQAGQTPAPDLDARFDNLRDRLAKVNRSQVATIFRALDDAADLPDPMKYEIKVFLLNALVERDPVGALALLPGTGWLEPTILGQPTLSDVLLRAAKADPFAARAWLEANVPHDNPALADLAWDALLFGAARFDPAVAIRFLPETGGDRTADRADGIGSAVRVGQRTAALEALRNLPGGLPPEASASFLRGIGRGLASGSFDSAAAWMEQARLAPAEIAAVAAGVSVQPSVAEPERWAGWIAATLPPGEAADHLAQLVRETARSYPPGPARDRVLRSILHHWPAADPAGRLEALREHGLAD